MPPFDLFLSHPAMILVVIFGAYILYRIIDRIRKGKVEYITDECDFGYAEPDSTFIDQDMNEWGYGRDRSMGKRRDRF